MIGKSYSLCEVNGNLGKIMHLKWLATVGETLRKGKTEWHIATSGETTSLCHHSNSRDIRLQPGRERASTDSKNTSSILVKRHKLLSACVSQQAFY
jgi:hypothetical protein